MLGGSSGELVILPGSDGRLTALPEVSTACPPYSKIGNLLAVDKSWVSPNVVTGLPTAWAISWNEAFFRIKSITLSNWGWSADPSVLSKDSRRYLWLVSSWIVRFTATFRLRSRLGSK